MGYRYSSGIRLILEILSKGVVVFRYGWAETVVGCHYRSVISMQ